MSEFLAWNVGGIAGNNIFLVDVVHRMRQNCMLQSLLSAGFIIVVLKLATGGPQLNLILRSTAEKQHCLKRLRVLVVFGLLPEPCAELYCMQGLVGMFIPQLKQQEFHCFCHTDYRRSTGNEGELQVAKMRTPKGSGL